MKIHVLKDKKGKVVASFEPDPGAAIRLEPQIPKGHKVEKLEVSEDYASHLGVLYKKRKGK